MFSESDIVEKSEYVHAADGESFTDYVLHILDEEHSENYKIPVSAVKKVIDVKTDMYACSDIKVSQQIWSGWPASCTSDDLMLSQLGMTERVLELSFRAAPLLESIDHRSEEDCDRVRRKRLYSIRLINSTVS